MKRSVFKLLFIALIITVNSCKNESKIEYKYAESPKILACELEDSELLNEAIHSFESDINAFYNNSATNTFRAYSGFLTNTANNRIDLTKVASKHSLKLAKALKSRAQLWNMESKTPTLNYSHPLVDCIANNIKTQYLKQTFNALLATNSMRKNVVMPAIQGAARSIPAEGSLKAFLAFEYYFPNIWDLTPESLTAPEPPKNTKVDFNKTPKTPVKTQEKTDPHAGHNHD